MGKPKPKSTVPPPGAELRIIGGQFRRRKLRYHGDPSTRPMKDRVREAIFNLISTEVAGKHAIDLFAGTGALGLEALSRGAVSATFIEKHIPTARVVEENIATLGVDDRSTVAMTSAFVWGSRDVATAGGSSSSPLRVPPSTAAWLVFCSPPYSFYVNRSQEVLGLIGTLVEHAPAGSIMVVEADSRFDFSLLPGEVVPTRDTGGWNVRTYPPAVVGILRKGALSTRN